MKIVMSALRNLIIESFDDEEYSKQDEFEDELGNYPTPWDLNNDDPQWWHDLFEEANELIVFLVSEDPTARDEDRLEAYRTAADAFLSEVANHYDIGDQSSLDLATRIMKECDFLLQRTENQQQINNLYAQEALRSGDPQVRIAYDEYKTAENDLMTNASTKNGDDIFALMLKAQNTERVFKNSLKQWSARHKNSNMSN